MRHTEKTVADYVEHQSAVEARFAEQCDLNDRVRFFVKLPRWFTVDTPIGPYNPDWAVHLEQEGAEPTLYLVQETKGALDTEALRTSEARKIACGHKHFAAIGVKYAVAISLSDTLRAAHGYPEMG